MSSAGVHQVQGVNAVVGLLVVDVVVVVPGVGNSRIGGPMKMVNFFFQLFFYYLETLILLTEDSERDHLCFHRDF